MTFNVVILKWQVNRDFIYTFTVMEKKIVSGNLTHGSQ